MACKKYDKVILNGLNVGFMIEDETEEVLGFSYVDAIEENKALQDFFNWIEKHIVPQKDKLLTGCFYIGEWLEITQDGETTSEFYLSEIYYEEHDIHFNDSVIRNEASILKLSVTFEKEEL